MSEPLVENEFQYRATLQRIAALEKHLDALEHLRRMAHGHRAALIIEDDDLRDLAPLDDARCDVAYTRKQLRRAVSEWEDLIAYGRSQPTLAPVAKLHDS